MLIMEFISRMMSASVSNFLLKDLAAGDLCVFAAFLASFALDLFLDLDSFFRPAFPLELKSVLLLVFWGCEEASAVGKVVMSAAWSSPSSQTT